MPCRPVSAPEIRRSRRRAFSATGHIEERLLQPERLEVVLASVLEGRQERADRRREHIAELHLRAEEADLPLKRAFMMPSKAVLPIWTT